MPVENRQIASGAITDTKVSKNAGIKGSKLEVAEPGQILVADEKGRFQPKHVDFEKCCDNKIPDDVLRSGDLEDGKIYVGGRDGVPVQIPAIPDPERVVKTDPVGVITDDTTMPLPNTNPTPPVKVGSSFIDLGNDEEVGLNVTTALHSVSYLLFETPDPPGNTTEYQFAHDLGYIPDVRVMEHSTGIEIDAEVSVDTVYATVKLSDSGTRLKVLVQ